MRKTLKAIKVIFHQLLKQSKFHKFFKKNMIRKFFMNRKNLEARKRLLSMKVLTNNFNKHKKNLISKKIRNIR